MKRFGKVVWKIVRKCMFYSCIVILALIICALIACVTARLWQTPWAKPISPEASRILLTPKLRMISENEVPPNSAYAQLSAAMKMPFNPKNLLGDNPKRAEEIIDASQKKGEISDSLATALHLAVEKMVKDLIKNKNDPVAQKLRKEFASQIAGKFPSTSAVKTIVKELKSTPDWKYEVSDFCGEERRQLSFERYSEEKFPFVAFLLIKNHVALSSIFKVAASLKVPDFGVKLKTDGSALNLSDLLKTTNLIRLSAMREASQNHPEEAFDQLNSMLNMGDTMTAGKAMIGNLVAISAASISLSAMQEIAMSDEVSPSLLQREISWLAKWQTEQPYDLAEAWKVESGFFDKQTDKLFGDAFAIAKNNIFSAESPRLFGTIIWTGTHLNRLMGYSKKTVLHDHHVEMRNLIALTETPYDRSRFADFYGQFHDKGFVIWKRDPVGYFFVREAMVVIAPIYYKNLESRFEIEATRVTLAVRAYQIVEKKLPFSLNALAPNYLPAIPRDPFLESSPLRFRAKPDGTWFIYSVGSDQTEDGGTQPEKKYRASLTAKGDLVLHSDEAARRKTIYKKRH